METNEQNINPLDIDLSSAKLPERPLLAGPQTLDLKVEKAELVSGTTNTESKMLSLELSTTGPAQLITGETANAGIRVFHRMNYAVTGKLKPEQIAEEFITLVQAVGGITGARVSNLADWYKQLEGKVVPTRVVIEPESTNPTTGRTYPPKNAVGRFIVKK